MRIAALVIACLACLPFAIAEEEAEPAHPLGCWAGLVGGEWHARGSWETGSPFVARLKAEWGPAKSFLRLKTFIPVKDGEHVRYDAVYYLHPAKKKPAYFSAGYEGAASAGTFEIREDTVTFVHPVAGDASRGLKSTWQFVTKDRCRWIAWQGESDRWTKLIAVEFVRGEQPAKKLIKTSPPGPHHLAPLDRFVGGRFKVTGLLADETPVSGALEHSWGVTHQVMVTKTFVTREEEETLGFVGFTWWDAERKTFRMIEFSAFGVFSEGTLTVNQDTVVLAFTTWSKDGAKDYRQWTLFETDDRITWYVEEKTEEGWRKLTERMIGERISER